MRIYKVETVNGPAGQTQSAGCFPSLAEAARASADWAGHVVVKSWSCGWGRYESCRGATNGCAHTHHWRCSQHQFKQVG